MVTRLSRGAQGLLGMTFIVFGANFVFHFLPMPPSTQAGGAMMGALFGTGYFLQFVKIVEIVGGVLVLTGRYTPLGILLLAPIVVQILLFHLFLAPGGMLMAIGLVALEAFLGFVHFDKFSHLFFPAAS